jgi:hypothetical protein
MSLEIFYEKAAEGLLASVCTDNYYIGFQRHMLSWRENLSAHVACVYREASARPGKV